MRTMNVHITTCNELPTLVRYHSSRIRPEMLHMLFVIIIHAVHFLSAIITNPSIMFVPWKLKLMFSSTEFSCELRLSFGTTNLVCSETVFN